MMRKSVFIAKIAARHRLSQRSALVGRVAT